MKSKLSVYLLTNKVLIGMNLLGFYLFAKIAEEVIEKEHILLIDQWMNNHINVIQTPTLTKFMLAITNLNGTMGIFIFSLFMTLFLLYKRWYIDLVFYIFSVSGANIAFIAIKIIIQRARPSSDILTIATHSFPSGHATMATAMALAVYFIFVNRVHTKSLHLCLSLFCVSWIGMIAFSRIYLDVHWLSDVIAGIGLGLFWVTFIVLTKKYIQLIV